MNKNRKFKIGEKVIYHGKKYRIQAVDFDRLWLIGLMYSVSRNDVEAPRQ